MEDLQIEIQFPHGKVPDIEIPEELWSPSVITRRVTSRRDNSFDANMRSDSTIVDVVTWVVGSGAVGASAKLLKDVIIAYLANRSVEIEVSIGDRNLTVKGPLSKKQVESILKDAGLPESE